MKITIEIETEKPIVFEGDMCLVSVGTYVKGNDTIKPAHLACGNYAQLSRLLVGQAAELQRCFNAKVKEETAQSGEGEPK